MGCTRRIKEKASELGFELVGIAPAQPVPELQFYIDWLEAGYAGKMEYLKNNLEKRTDPVQIIPEARSIIVCAMIYHSDQPLSIDCTDNSRGWISRYSWGDDYHDVLKKKLFELFDFVKHVSDDDIIGKVYVDTGPILDRVYARYAGIGWFGKNTCIINQQHGSWFFLGEIITDLELEYDNPAPDRCGSCERCIDACPTDAILKPYVLDATRCISYLTIELKDEIPSNYRDQMGNHIFGCDICQDVCPWNRKAEITQKNEFQPRKGLVNPELDFIADMSLEDFRETFRNSPVKRAKHRGILRNTAVAMGNSGHCEYIPILKKLESSSDASVANHARWAIDKLSRSNS
jgi:epoxyqueuosine reductase